MLKKTLLGSMGGLLIAIVAATSANANTTSIPYPIGGTVNLTVGDVQYGAHGDCTDAPVSVSIQTPDDYAYMDFDFTSTYDGPTSWADENYDYGSYSGTYTDTFLVCPSFDNPGNYVGRVAVTFYDFDWNEITTVTATDAFRVSAYAAPTHTSSLTTTKTRFGAHSWKLRSVAKYDGHVWKNHLVRLQVKTGGAWHNYNGGQRTDSLGRTVFAVNPPAGRAYFWRTVLTAGPGVTAKASPAMRLSR